MPQLDYSDLVAFANNPLFQSPHIPKNHCRWNQCVIVFKRSFFQPCTGSNPCLRLTLIYPYLRLSSGFVYKRVIFWKSLFASTLSYFTGCGCCASSSLVVSTLLTSWLLTLLYFSPSAPRCLSYPSLLFSTPERTKLQSHDWVYQLLPSHRLSLLRLVIYSNLHSPSLPFLSNLSMSSCSQSRLILLFACIITNIHELCISNQYVSNLRTGFVEGWMRTTCATTLRELAVHCQ